MVSLEKQNYEKNKKIYNEVVERLRKSINYTIPIDHVGSTAIPNMMYGKNIIDILIGAKNIEEFNKIKELLLNMSYIFSTKSSTDIYMFFKSKDDETSAGDIHIHLVIMNTERYKEFLILKNYLLNNPEEVKKYSDYKQKILENGIYERKEYKSIKSKYVTDLIARAKKYYK